MKIGIVTVYNNDNYGSKLQSYALQTILRTLGVEVAENLLADNDIYKITIVRRIKYKIKTTFQRFSKTKHQEWDSKYKVLHNKFISFKKNYISESRFSPSQIKKRRSKGINDYDYYICGSDQIWAPNQFHSEYFLAFINDKNVKISYATSIGLPRIPSELQETYRNLINDISFVSMREQDGANLVEEITKGRKVPVVLDPTFLLSKKDWNRIAVTPQTKDYILCLFLGNNDLHRKWVLDLSESTGLKLVTLPLRQWDYEYGDDQRFDAGPQEFIGLVESANYICTDSFHGIAFSINFNKEFFAFTRFSNDDPICQNSRIYNLLDDLGLRQRLVDDQSSIKDFSFFADKKISWQTVNEKIEQKRTFSLNYLRKALKIN